MPFFPLYISSTYLCTSEIYRLLCFALVFSAIRPIYGRKKTFSLVSYRLIERDDTKVIGTLKQRDMKREKLDMLCQQ